MTKILAATDKTAKNTTLLDLECCSFVRNLLAMNHFQFMKASKNTTHFSFPLLLKSFIVSLTLLHNGLFGQRLPIQVGAERMNEYLPMLKGKTVGVITNHTAIINGVHLIDTLINSGISIKRIFAPEHGFRGDAANGETVSNGTDLKTGLPIISLYGKNKKPNSAQLQDLDILIFDIQDVGVRFYTYLTTMHFCMEACAENKVSFMVLDRPNPNGYYIDGPILEKEHQSMVGLHSIPLVHGMTLGELALMIRGESWITQRDSLQLTIIPCLNYDHNRFYKLPIAPSPNLPSQESIILYPTLGLFEGINISMGRGTDKPFEIFGAPWLKIGSYKFIPNNIPGKAINPPFVGQECRGMIVSDFASEYLISFRHIYLEWILLLYQEYPKDEKNPFFNSFFTKLAGTETLRKQIESGKTVEEIRQSWAADIESFIAKRKPYLIYSYFDGLGLQRN